MEQKIYIKAKDKNGNWNIWEVINDISIYGVSVYEIYSRNTYEFVEKRFCFCEYGSSLLSYEKGDRVINVEDSDIEYESENEYRIWKREQTKNINPFKVCDEVDFGYLEDMWHKENLNVL